MKKISKLVSLATVAALILSSNIVAFAADSNMNFTGTPINLSLEQAYKTVMTSGTAIESAKLNKEATESAAEDANSSLRLLQKTLERTMEMPTGVVGREMIRMQRDHAPEQAELDYGAEVNAINTKTMEKYYTTKNTEDMLRIARENLAVQEKILENTKLKFNVGTVSKQDVTSAEIAVNTAKNNITTAEKAVALSKMDLNVYLGYDLMQAVNLTDEIKESSLPSKSLETSIKDALTNRNEIKDIAFKTKMQAMNIESMRYNTSVVSMDFIKAKQALLQLEKANSDMPNNIEMDVRNKYLAMVGAKSKIELGRASLEQAKENFRLAQLSYDAGMNTITDVQNAQLAVFNAETNLANDLLEYNLAIMQYEISSTVGTYTSTGSSGQ